MTSTDRSRSPGTARVDGAEVSRGQGARANRKAGDLCTAEGARDAAVWIAAGTAGGQTGTPRRSRPFGAPGGEGVRDACVGFVANGAADVARVRDDSHANPRPSGAGGVDRLPIGAAYIDGEKHKQDQGRRDQGELDQCLAALAAVSSGPALDFHYDTKDTEPTLCWPGPGPPVVLNVYVAYA